MEQILKTKFNKLKELLKSYRKVMIAYSGGVDSTFLTKVAYDTLKDNAIAITGVSQSYPNSEFVETKKIAEEIGIRYLIIKIREINNSNYSSNPYNRCYYCKNELYKKIKQVANKYKIKYILDGSNLDDMKDIRYGIKAAKEKGIISPLKLVGLTKNEIRVLSKELGLPTWDKPATPCLASRVEYGVTITTGILKQIEMAEKFLKELGIRNLRVRYHKQIARIETDTDEFRIIIKNRKKIVDKFKQIGFVYVTLDLQGFRSGSMNEVLKI